MAARHPYRRGDVVLVRFPFSGASGHKRRPGVVISTDIYHDQWDELLVVALTTKAPTAPRPTDCPVRDWHAAGLQHSSWMRGHFATVYRHLIVGKVGQLTPMDLQAVEACLRIAVAL
jgi:mRNA interferase MazF